MFWSSLSELDLCIGLLMVILYGLFSLRSQCIWNKYSQTSFVTISLGDLLIFCRFWPILVVLSYYVDLFGFFNILSVESIQSVMVGSLQYLGVDMLLALLTFIILGSFKSLESTIFLMVAFIGQLFMLHTSDLLNFYICLETQNFCFIVLCALQSYTNVNSANSGKQNSSSFVVEACLKYLLLSAFASGVILFGIASIYLNTGTTSLYFSNLALDSSQFGSFLILIAMLFKLGTAPLHMWVVDIYSASQRQLIMFLSTAPKLSLFAYWVSAWHQVWTDFTIASFVVFSMLLGSFGAYLNPALRALFAYSTVNEIGLMLMAIETAGFHSLFQHLFIYIVTQLLLWNLSDKRLFSLTAVSLAGLPPLAGFFGKAALFWHSVSVNAFPMLIVALMTTGISLVYYLRVVRLFWSKPNLQALDSLAYTRGLACDYNVGRVYLTSTCVVFLCVFPIFFVKPFIL